MVGPESEYERHGDVDVMSYSRVDTPWAGWRQYQPLFGAAGCAIALAQGSVRALLEWLEANGGCERRQRSAGLMDSGSVWFFTILTSSASPWNTLAHGDTKDSSRSTHFSNQLGLPALQG